MTTATATLVRPAAGSRLRWAIADSRAMAGRNVRRLMRAPDQLVFTLISPIMFTLLFRYVFGGAINGLGDINYVNYLIPGIAVQTAIFTAGNSGFALAEDRGTGFIDRLRSLPMARSAVLTGRVSADTLSNAMGLLIIVLVGVAVGFRPSSIPGLLLGMLLLLAFALSTCFIFALVGLYASNSQTVNAATFPVIFPLTFASSAFVPTSTMPSWLQAFADHQPVTIVINAVRSLTIGDVSEAQRQDLFNGLSTTSLVIQSLLWTLGIGLVFGYLSVRRYNSTAS
ncbi:ABC transporter permease [Jatrophihabitans sp. DSM 45814]